MRPLADADGKETGMFEVPAGGRRFRALQLLVKQKKMPKTAPIPCIVKTDGLAEEDSLAENVMREALHPFDQFRAFRTLRACRSRRSEPQLCRYDRAGRKRTDGRYIGGFGESAGRFGD